ncbi:MAG: PIN domain-containing protein [Acidobacteria bacterium]|nr:PIN domain-containing protein [Acidobacteriota bacterium]
MRCFLADVNVWLATIVEDHPHHTTAIRWWQESLLPEEGRVAFCRITQLGFLRLLTNERVMGKQRKTIEGAWSIYERALAAKPVVFASEPERTESFLVEHCRLGGSSRKFWTDGYLAAFARAGSLGLVTFDRDFERFPALELTRLEPGL